MSKENLKNRGITLLSLILTIIIMLILTGVALSIALGDNGIIDKANEAVEETQIATDKELLLSAAIGAMGNDGKVDLSAMILPEGFTGSNGTYTCEDGHTFTVSENGDIVYTGGSGSDDGTETLDLNGKYYPCNGIGESEEYLIIENNNSLKMIAYDSSTETEEVVGELPIASIDEDNKTLIIHVYPDMNVLDVYETMTVPYMLIEENGSVVNKAVILDGLLLVQNENSVEYGGISGTYYTEDETKRITFDSANSTVNGESDYNKTGSWSSNKYINNEDYCILDGYLVIMNQFSSERNDYTVVECDGDTYYKQN